MGLSDSRLRWTSRLLIPGRLLAPAPSSSGSPRFLGASFRKRLPLTPRSAPQVPLPVASLQVSGFILYGGLPALTQINEAETGSLSLRLSRSWSVGFSHFPLRFSSGHRSASPDRLPSHRGPPLHGERAISIGWHLSAGKMHQACPGAP